MVLLCALLWADRSSNYEAAHMWGSSISRKEGRKGPLMLLKSCTRMRLLLEGMERGPRELLPSMRPGAGWDTGRGKHSIKRRWRVVPIICYKYLGSREILSNPEPWEHFSGKCEGPPREMPTTRVWITDVAGFLAASPEFQLKESIHKFNKTSQLELLLTE